MPSQAARRSVPVPGHRSITEAEKLAEAKLGGISLRHDQMAVVANIYRAASAVRQHLENSVVCCADLTWTARARSRGLPGRWKGVGLYREPITPPTAGWCCSA